MLYNPKWDRIYTTENFAAWLLQQPRTKRYNFCDPGKCAIAQYLQAHGLTNWREYSMPVDRIRELGWISIVCNAGAETFGGAANRALKQLPFKSRLILRNDWRTSLARFFGLIPRTDTDRERFETALSRV